MTCWKHCGKAWPTATRSSASSGAGAWRRSTSRSDLRHDRPVALKVLHPELAATLGPERFLREIQLAARLQHPHILTVLDSGEAGGPPLVHHAVRRGREPARPAPARAAAPAGRRAPDRARGGAGARLRPRARRRSTATSSPRTSCSPRDGNTLVADFGIARALGERRDEQLTETGLAIGTPAYMSPEQASRRSRARRAHRHLQPGCGAVRDAGRRAAVHRRRPRRR